MYCTMQNRLWDITFWDGSKLIGSAENIVAPNEVEAVKRGLRAMSHRKREQKHAKQLLQLKAYLDAPNTCTVPDGMRVFVVEKDRGTKVIG